MQKSKILMIGVAIITCCVATGVLYKLKWGIKKHNDETIEYISARRPHVSDDQWQKIPEEKPFSSTAIATYKNKSMSSQSSHREFRRQNKRLSEAYNLEMNGRFDEALEQYQTIAESSGGSEQIGAVNRYRMALRRKYKENGGLKKEIDKIRKKTVKTAFEHILISNYKGSNERQCYRTLLDEYPDSVLREYAEMNFGYYYDPSEDGSYKEFLPRAIQSMEQFIHKHPNSDFVPYAKIRIASCYDNKKETGEEAVMLYKQVLQHYPDDKLISAKCIIGLYWLGVFEDSDLYKTAEEVGMFYGTYGNGYFLRSDFDLENTDLSLVWRYIREER